MKILLRALYLLWVPVYVAINLVMILVGIAILACLLFMWLALLPFAWVLTGLRAYPDPGVFLVDGLIYYTLDRKTFLDDWDQAFKNKLL